MKRKNRSSSLTMSTPTSRASRDPTPASKRFGVDDTAVRDVRVADAGLRRRSCISETTTPGNASVVASTAISQFSTPAAQNRQLGSYNIGNGHQVIVFDQGVSAMSTEDGLRIGRHANDYDLDVFARIIAGPDVYIWVDAQKAKDSMLLSEDEFAANFVPDNILKIRELVDVQLDPKVFKQHPKYLADTKAVPKMKLQLVRKYLAAMEKGEGYNPISKPWEICGHREIHVGYVKGDEYVVVYAKLGEGAANETLKFCIHEDDVKFSDISYPKKSTTYQRIKFLGIFQQDTEAVTKAVIKDFLKNMGDPPATPQQTELNSMTPLHSPIPTMTAVKSGSDMDYDAESDPSATDVQDTPQTTILHLRREISYKDEMIKIQKEMIENKNEGYSLQATFIRNLRSRINEQD